MTIARTGSPSAASDVEDGAPGESVAQHIARAAARLFASQGYDATSVREIVEAAGVTKPTLYYHFGSKEGLAQALFTVPMTRLVERLKNLVDGPGETVDVATGMIETHFAFCREDPDRGRFVYALFFGPLASGLATELARFSQELTAIWSQLSRRFASSKIIDPARAQAFTTNLRGMIVVYTTDFLYKGDALGPDLAPRLVRDLLDGFRKDGCFRR
jgi:AcrR family transcriptional regulator